MRLAPIVERIEATVPVLRHVDGISGLALLSEESARPGSAYVAPVAESASDNTRVGSATRQVITVRFAVVLILGGQARNRQAVSEELEAMTAAVKAGLIGWVHPDATTETTYRSGRLLRATGGQLAWQLEFQTRQQETLP
jgi:hypothetical protein